jgi:hypothetical protein
MLSLRKGIPLAYKPRKGAYRPVNQAGFRSIFAGSLGAKARADRRRLRHR